MTKTSSIQPTDISFTHAADFYLKKYRNGDAPPVEVFAQAFPHLADQLVAEIPAMLMLEQMIRGQDRTQVGLKKKLGNSHIEAEIGRGGMGTVYRARQPELDRTVAIKVITLLNSSRSVIDRFELERRAMARLEHPNIVPVYDYGHDERFAFLVMKFIEGFNLLQLIDAHAPYRAKVKLAELQADWRDFAAMGADVASGLQHAHDQGLVHRDIKPSNLILDPNNKIWITDFGLAKMHDLTRNLSNPGDAIGTPRYMAPEQIRGFCDARSDVYSLGLTLYELAVGDCAWGTESAIDAVFNNKPHILSDVRERNPCVPNDLAKIIMKACELDPQMRYQTAGEFETVLRRFIAGCPVSDRRRGRRLTDEQYRRRSKIRSIASVFAVVACSVAAFVASHFLTTKNSVPEKSDEATRFSPHQLNLLEKLADEERSDFVGIVADFVKESVDDASVELKMSDEGKQALIGRVDEIVHQIKTEGLKQSSVDSILHSYKDSTLPLGTKILRVNHVVQRSTLTPQEKLFASQLLKNFAGFAVTQQIPSDEVKTLLNALTHNRTYTAEELQTFVAPDQTLRAWFATIEARLRNVPVSEVDMAAVQDEISRIFNQTKNEPTGNVRSEAAPSSPGPLVAGER